MCIRDRPATVGDQKLKKRDGTPDIALEPTTDILAALGQIKPSDQVLVGFAAETTDLRANAAAKLQAKNADLIVANDVAGAKTGFGHDTNAVVILGADGSDESVSLTSKREVADAVLSAAVRRVPPA